jgi:hypothetical protein
MVGVVVSGTAADHSSLWVFGGSNHPDREDGENRRPHLIQLHSRDRLYLRKYDLGIIPVFCKKLTNYLIGAFTGG